MGAEYPGALWVPNNNAFVNRGGYTPRWIILHGTAGGTSAEAIANYFKSTEGTTNQSTSHFVIGQDGEIVQCVALADGAWANGFLSQGHDPWWDPSINPNDITASIEHCKPSTDNSDSLTPAQQDSSFKLVAWLCQTLNIPARAADANGGITGHYSIDPVNRSRCPGPYPWDALWSFLGGTTSMSGIPNGWSDDGTILTAPNGVGVRQGFRDYILNNAWDPGNWPLELEHAQQPVELSNPGLGNGTQQVFRWSVLEWTPDRGVFFAWGGQELLAIRNQFTSAQKSISALQQQVQLFQSGKPLEDLQSRLKQINSLSTI